MLQKSKKRSMCWGWKRWEEHWQVGDDLETTFIRKGWRTFLVDGVVLYPVT